MKNTAFILVAGVTCLTAALSIAAESDARSDNGGVTVNAKARTRRILYPIAIPVASGTNETIAKQIAETMSFDLNVSGWFRTIDPNSFLADLKKEGMSIEPDAWKAVKAFGVVKSSVVPKGNKLILTFSLFEVQKGRSAVLKRTYSVRPSSVRRKVHEWSNAVVKHFTGENSFFGSRIAFVSKRRSGGKRVMVMGFDGKGAYTVSPKTRLNILPTWSPNGNKLAFTSFKHTNLDLFTVPSGGGTPHRLCKYRGMNTGAAYSPDGSQIALTLSKDGNPEIYLVSATNCSIIRRLTHNRDIDTSPAWSPDGKEIAFVSDREGGPQIFVMQASGNNQHRVSMNGNYNTTPTWSPRKGERRLAYTTRDKSVYDIVTLDLNSGAYTRITQGQGQNEEPSFSPDGRAIAWSARRSGGWGIYIANADGTGKQRRVWKGYATGVEWSR